MTRIIKGSVTINSGRSLAYCTTLTFHAGFGNIIADGRQRIMEVVMLIDSVTPPATKSERSQVETAVLDRFRVVGSSALWGLPA